MYGISHTDKSMHPETKFDFHKLIFDIVLLHLYYISPHLCVYDVNTPGVTLPVNDLGKTKDWHSKSMPN